MPPQFDFRGREQLAQLYQDKIEELGPQPFIQNHVIQVDGDTATMMFVGVSMASGSSLGTILSSTTGRH